MSRMSFQSCRNSEYFSFSSSGLMCMMTSVPTESFSHSVTV